MALRGRVQREMQWARLKSSIHCHSYSYHTLAWLRHASLSIAIHSTLNLIEDFYEFPLAIKSAPFQFTPMFILYPTQNYLLAFIPHPAIYAQLIPSPDLFEVTSQIAEWISTTPNYIQIRTKFQINGSSIDNHSQLFTADNELWKDSLWECIIKEGTLGMTRNPNYRQGMRYEL